MEFRQDFWLQNTRIRGYLKQLSAWSYI